MIGFIFFLLNISNLSKLQQLYNNMTPPQINGLNSTIKSSVKKGRGVCGGKEEGGKNNFQVLCC